MTLSKWFEPHKVEGKGIIAQGLQRHPILRSGLYLVASIVTVRGIVYLYDITLYRGRETEGDLVSRLTVVPCILFLTWSFAKLRKEDIQRWYRIPSEQALVHFIKGAGLGTCGFLAVVGVASCLGWVRFPVDHSGTLQQQDVVHTLLRLGAQYAAVSCYEEMIYRGYGLDTALATGQRYIAIPLLASIFALAHGPGWQGFASHGAMALAATALRFSSDSLWLPIGYHFAWNYVQTAVLGPPDGRPSLIPLEVTGPSLWVGRPGYAEPPGLLVAIAHAVIGLLYTLARWKHAKA